MARSLLALACVLFAACGGTPTQPAGPPNLTGVWQGPSTEVAGDRRTFTITFTLTQAPGAAAIEGTVVQTIAGASFQETVTSSTQTGQRFTLQTAYTNPLGQVIRFTHDGSVDPARTELSGGTLLAESTSPISTFTARRVQ